MPPNEDFDPRDQLWEETFATYYDSYYNELLADRLVGKWQLLDSVSSVLVAITATSSAVAGWALWSLPGWQILWGIFASGAAVLSIIHSRLSVPERLKESLAVMRLFGELRVRLETFRDEMRINPEFPVDEFTERYRNYREQLGACVQQISPNLLKTNRLKLCV